MNNYFQVRIRVTKNVKEKPKRIFEVYLVQAYSFTEAEANITKALMDIQEYKTMTISSIDRYPIDSIYNFDFSGKYWICKVDLTATNEKPIKLRYLVNETNAESAAEKLKSVLENNSTLNHEILSISSSPIVEIFEQTTKEKTDAHNQGK